MRLILCSEFHHVANKLLLQGFLDKSEKRVGFIQNATDNRLDKGDIIERLEQAKQRYKDNNFDIEIIDLRRYNNNEELYKKLSNYNYIHVHGGDIKHLSSVAQESGLYECIRRLLSQGIAYIGSSAGSILAGNEISYARIAEPEYTEGKWITTPGSMPGFGLHPFQIMPHCTRRKEVAIKRLEYCIENNNNPYITLTDNQAIAIEDNTFHFIQ